MKTPPLHTHERGKEGVGPNHTHVLTKRKVYTIDDWPRFEGIADRTRFITGRGNAFSFARAPDPHAMSF
jgi:hypothetical protein